MSRFEFLHWLRGQAMGHSWEWFEQLSADGSKSVGVDNNLGDRFEAETWDEVAALMVHAGIAQW